MNVRIPKGTYVLAVSGGIDSVTLLDILAKQSDLELVVAHFEHGIRPDSKKDEEFVRQTAKSYNLRFESGHGNLGAGASEERAREARYHFLSRVKDKYQANGVITAHHQDDLLETAFINIIRGSGRRGLTAIADNRDIIRPLLGWPKKDILAYAKKQNLRWRDDPSNLDETILRNYVRRHIVPELSYTQRQQVLDNLKNLSALNQSINQEIANLSQNIINGNKIDRSGFTALPSEVAGEALMFCLRGNGISGLDKPAIGRLVMAVKNAKPGTKYSINRGTYLKITASTALLDTALNR
jgi:tRNA(Ile)-lysidine synthase